MCHISFLLFKVNLLGVNSTSEESYSTFTELQQLILEMYKQLEIPLRSVSFKIFSEVAFILKKQVCASDTSVTELLNQNLNRGNLMLHLI